MPRVNRTAEPANGQATTQTATASAILLRRSVGPGSRIEYAGYALGLINLIVQRRRDTLSRTCCFGVESGLGDLVTVIVGLLKCRARCKARIICKVEVGDI